MSSDSSSDRPFSVTFSEDDLRPHMRKPKPLKLEKTKEIEELQKKMEKREKVKMEVKKRVEQEEKEREIRKREAEIRRETEELLRKNNEVEQVLKRKRALPDTLNMPRLGRRYNNSQYFKWDSDEETAEIREEIVSRPASRRRTPSFPVESACELCTLARRAIDKDGAPTRSAACAHVDAFVSSRRF